MLGSCRPSLNEWIGTVVGSKHPTPQLASARVVSPSAHDSAVAWRLPRLKRTTAAGSRAGSVAATKRQITPLIFGCIRTRRGEGGATYLGWSILGLAAS